VDSTVTATLLQKEGYEVIGVYMIMHNLKELNEKNIKNAKKVANYLGIKFLTHDIQDSFKDEVYNYFVDSYKQGLTPNPCVICNRQIKFGKMIELADSLGINFIATGHYAQVKEGFFYKGVDESKDQSYFLAKVNKNIVNRVIFPLGSWLKEDVKKYAANIDVLQDIAKQKESSEICFVENSYVDILKEHMDINKPGVVKNKDGKIVGEHKGYMHYTIGKRRGFFVKGAHEPHYVLELDAKTNTLIVGKKQDLAKKIIKVANVNLFINSSSFECEVKVRYRTKGVKATVTLVGDSGLIELKEEVFGVAKGQIAVFYDNNKLLGGGEIVGVLDN
jgi:tRNA-specific 2-thiouridylase